MPITASGAKRAVADRNRRFQSAQDLVRSEYRHALARDARQQAGELIAAHPAELILLAQHPLAHAPGDPQHEGFSPLQSEQAIHLLDLWDMEQRATRAACPPAGGSRWSRGIYP